MSGEAQCYCCESVASLDRALDELGMLAAVPAGRRQHQAETRRRRRYTVSAVQRTPPTPVHAPALPSSSSAQIAEQMSRIRLDGAGGSGERPAFETLYINWDYVSGVGGGGGGQCSPAGGKARRVWSRPAKPYSADRPGGSRARTASWSQQELTAVVTQDSAPPPPPPPCRAPAVPAPGPLVRSLSLENLKLAEVPVSTAAGGAAAARAGQDVETISRRIEGLRVQYQ